jgi:hypothetical protein
MKRYILANGTLSEVSKFAAHWHIEAKTKTEALQKLAEYAARVIDNPPELKTKSGAWQLVTPALNGGWNVDAGAIRRDGTRAFALCSGWTEKRADADKAASFEYYASEEYQNHA